MLYLLVVSGQIDLAVSAQTALAVSKRIAKLPIGFTRCMATKRLPASSSGRCVIPSVEVAGETGRRSGQPTDSLHDLPAARIALCLRMAMSALLRPGS